MLIYIYLNHHLNKHVLIFFYFHIIILKFQLILTFCSKCHNKIRYKTKLKFLRKVEAFIYSLKKNCKISRRTFRKLRKEKYKNSLVDLLF